MSNLLPATFRLPVERALGAFALLASVASAQVEVLRMEGTQPAAEYGHALATIGDVDGDGVADFVIGAPGSVGANGYAEVISGATFGVLRSHKSLGGQLGASIADLGDVDFDGVPDYAIAAQSEATSAGSNVGKVYAFSGATGTVLWSLAGTKKAEVFGSGLQRAPDMDGDGCAELLVRSGLYGTPANTVTVVTSTGAPLLVLNTIALAPLFVGRAGDLNGDGVDELLVGAPTYSTSGNLGEGLVQIFSGASGSLIGSFTGTNPGDGIGLNTIGIADFDGDGIADLLVSGWGNGLRTNNGVVEIRSGATLQPLLRIDGGRYESLGAYLARCGDWNLDGIEDWAVGMMLLSPPWGSIRIYSGADASLLHEIDGESVGDVHAHGFGESFAAGDWNLDGVGDLVAGAWYWHDADYQYEGAVYVELGCPAFSQSYGSGWSGAFGVPTLVANGDPVVGAPLSVTLSNSAGATTPGLLLIGLAPANLVLRSGATLLVDQPLVQIVSIPATGLTVSGALPDDPALYFTHFYLQGLELDAGAIGGIAMSAGLDLRCGFDL